MHKSTKNGKYLSQFLRATLNNLIFNVAVYSDISVGPECSDDVFAQGSQSFGVWSTIPLTNRNQSIMTDLAINVNKLVKMSCV